MRMRRTAGFTLVEVTIVVAVLALAAGLVVASVGSTSVAQLRKASGHLAGTIRATYDQAALNGQVHRLVLDFESSVIKVEAKPTGMEFDGGGGALAATQQALSAGAPLDSPERLNQMGDNLLPWVDDFEMSPDMVPAELTSPQEEDASSQNASPFMSMMSMGNVVGQNTGSAEFEATQRQVSLGEDVRLFEVWIRGMDEPANEDKVYLNFFPHGHTQEALIQLADPGDRIFAIRVEPLTGHTEILQGYQEPPD